MTCDLAVFTVVYPAAMPFVPDLLAGLARQSDDRFALIVALDSVEPGLFAALARDLQLPEVELHVVGGTPVEIRNKVLGDVCRRFSRVVLQDADDVPRHDRVAIQRAALDDADITASALALVDVNGRSLNRTLRAPAAPVDTFLARMNVFGFGNSAYRSEILAECLPVPGHLRAMDWFVATRAHLQGAVLRTCDAVIADYRQHGFGAAPVLAPLTRDDLGYGVEVCQAHLTAIGQLPAVEASSWVAPRLGELHRFQWWLRQDERNGLRYLEALNEQQDRVFAWWEFVASGSLEHLWTA